MVDGFVNYDKSEFDSPSQLGDDSELETIWNSQHSLQELLDRDNFKSYDELKTKLDRVLGLGNAGVSMKMDTSDFQTKQAPPVATAESVTVSADGDETLSYFANLANDQ